jgi:hypothetical protein
MKMILSILVTGLSIGIACQAAINDKRPEQIAQVAQFAIQNDFKPEGSVVLWLPREPGTPPKNQVREGWLKVPGKPVTLAAGPRLWQSNNSIAQDEF